MLCAIFAQSLESDFSENRDMSGFGEDIAGNSHWKVCERFVYLLKSKSPKTTQIKTDCVSHYKPRGSITVKTGPACESHFKH